MAEVIVAPKIEAPSPMTIFHQLQTDDALVKSMTVVSTIANTPVSKVETDEQEAKYTEMLIQAKGLLNQVEVQRKAIVDPLNRSTRAVNDHFKKHFAEPIAKKEAEINRVLSAYRVQKAKDAAKLQDEARKLQAEMQQQAEAAGVTVVVPAIVAPKAERVVRTESGQVHERKQLTVEVTSLRDLAQAVVDGKIPESALEPNMKTLRNLAMAGVAIPGVKYGYESKLAVRAA